MKRGKPLRRKTPLRAKKGLERGDGLSPVNRKRKAKESLRAYGPPERREIVAAMSCRVPGCQGGPIHQAHVPSRSGAGRKGDAMWIIPLCWRHHLELDERDGAEAFGDRHGIDVWEEARKVDAEAAAIMKDEGGG